MALSEQELAARVEAFATELYKYREENGPDSVRIPVDLRVRLVRAVAEA